MLPLQQRNSHPRDSHVRFHKDGHYYTVERGTECERAPVSVTSFAKAYFQQFDADAVIQERYPSWKSNVNSKYYSLIQAALQQGGSDAEARHAIAQRWVDVGEEASQAGTRMHERAEMVCNGLTPDSEDIEMEMLREWLSSFQPAMQWEPCRTEWILWWEEPRIDNRILVAGTLDLLLKSRTTGEHALVDFKRTNPAPKYRGAPANLLGPCGNPRFHPGYALAPLSELENSKYGAYCMQLNILAKMLRGRYDIDVGHNMYLLQIHADMAQAHCERVPLHKQATDALFAIEAERMRGVS